MNTDDQIIPVIIYDENGDIVGIEEMTLREYHELMKELGYTNSK